ncbi:MAG: epoxyqueuosine reductase [Candidatus Eisenbacteria sp.]|nr:epoxyqueuosine reductase [Candidatus Eisenbacteria bacterium]
MRQQIERIIRDHIGDRDFLLGFSDLYNIVDGEYSDLIYGITVGIRLDDEIVDEIGTIDGPTLRYIQHYRAVNWSLDQITGAIVQTLRAGGARAEAIPATLEEDPPPGDPYHQTLSASFPHKTAATRSGLGWIGKTALFVSDRFGPRVRLATVLTDCPVEVGTPCEMSLCGDCLCCVEACPAQAADGMEWFPGLEREMFFDAHRCRKKCRQLSGDAGEEGATVCGICMAACPVGVEFRTSETEDDWF